MCVCVYLYLCLCGVERGGHRVRGFSIVIVTVCVTVTERASVYVIVTVCVTVVEGMEKTGEREK